MPAVPVLARAALHHWEEPPISGTRGSGAVFFSGCNLGCVFCQNEEISQRGAGRAVSPERFGEILARLEREGAHNINFVTPTHYSLFLRDFLREQPPSLPVVWNSGGYERVEVLRTLEGLVQVYLPDLKYLDSGLAARYSHAPDYPEVAKAALREMVRQAGPCVFDEAGILQRGVLVRHLILPGQVPQAKAVMDYVAREYGQSVLFSLMSQYTPWGEAARMPELNRTLRRGEIRAAAEYMANLGLRGYVQQADSARREYTPDFDFSGL